jgi:hypothetical protein
MTKDKLSDFYIKTTVAFDVYVYKDMSVQDLEGTVSIIFKTNKDDTDDDAIISKDASSYGDDYARIVLSPTDTDVDSGTYYYEIKWTNADDDVYILQSDTVNILERVYD